MLTLLFFLHGDAQACGGFFGPQDRYVSSDAQQAIFQPDPDGTRVEYLVDFAGSAEDFGWVIPVPGTFVSLEEGDPDRFESLMEATQPDTVLHEQVSCGCGAASKGDLAGGMDSGELRDGVNVVAKGTAGIFDYVALEADSTEALLTWLTDHDFSVGPSGPSLDAYVSEGGFQFVAIEVNELPADASDTASWTAEKAAVSLVYSADSMRFPAMMSMTSTAPNQKTTVYVVADQMATVSGWSGVRLEEVDGPDYQGESGSWDAALWAMAGTRPVYGLVFSGEVEGEGWVTRYDTWANSEVHTLDAVFTADGGSEQFRSEIHLWENEGKGEDKAADPEFPAMWILFPALGAGWIRRRNS